MASAPEPEESYDLLDPPAAGRVDRGSRRDGGGLCRPGDRCLPLDLGIGRRTRPLGPQHLEVAARRETVFDLIAEPYLGRTPRALADKVRVLERGSDMVLAAHFTPLGGRLGLVAQTVETVRFSRPERVDFRLVRGPVPYVVESFELETRDGGTALTYTGELGTDLWAVGQRWGDVVAARWEAVVRASLQTVASEAERRAVR
jgi:hypothetical protein